MIRTISVLVGTLINIVFSFYPKPNFVSLSFYHCRLLAAIRIGGQSGAKVNVLCAGGTQGQAESEAKSPHLRVVFWHRTLLRSENTFVTHHIV